MFREASLTQEDDLRGFDAWPGKSGHSGRPPEMTRISRPTCSPALRASPRTRSARRGARRRTWLDTFDWRLYRAGLMLEFEQARRGGRLLLSRADGTPQAEQPVTGWPPRRPARTCRPGRCGTGSWC